MAFYQWIEKDQTVTFQLTRLSVIFHFIFFRVYPYLLIALGLGLMFLMAYESGPDQWLVFVGLLPIAIAIYMLTIKYPLQIDFTKEGIKQITKGTFSGTIESFYYTAQIKEISYRIVRGKDRGFLLSASLTNGKKSRLYHIPSLRLNQPLAIQHATKAASILGFELMEEK